MKQKESVSTVSPSEAEEDWINAEFIATQELLQLRMDLSKESKKPLSLDTCQFCTAENWGKVKPRTDYF